MQTIKIEHTLHYHDNFSQFNEEEVKLLLAAQKASLRAYAPYSKFHVGAAALLEDGQIIEGNNQENVAYPSGLCAERVALFYANAQYPGVKIKSLAVTIDYSNVEIEDIIPPCGSCRQVIAECEYKQKEPIKIFLLGKDQKVLVINSITEILPLIFSGDILKMVKTEEV